MLRRVLSFRYGPSSTSPVIVKQHAWNFYQKNPTFTALPLAKQQSVVQAYAGSFLAPLPMVVVGPSPNLWTPSGLVNFKFTSNNPFPKLPNNTAWVNPGWQSDPTEARAAEMLNEELAQILRDASGSSGSILFDRAWSLISNDAFIRGAMDSDKEIHVASEGTAISDIPKVKLFDTDNSRPRVLGRELLYMQFNGAVEPCSTNIPIWESFCSSPRKKAAAFDEIEL